MALSAETQYTLYIDGTQSITLLSVHDGEVLSEVPLGHRLVGGTSNGNMIATIGEAPYSVNIINDRHKHEQQLLELSDEPVAVAISPAQDTIAVMLDNGQSFDWFHID